MGAAESSTNSSQPPSGTGVGGQAVVVGPEYCSSYPLELAVKKKIYFFSDEFAITDVQDNHLLPFRVQSVPFSFRQKLIAADAAGLPILTIMRKFWSIGGTWQVFRGEDSTDDEHLICIVERGFALIREKLNVYLANNTTEELCDFQIIGGFLDNSYTVYAGDQSDSAMVAQIHQKFTAGSFFFGEHQYMVTVNPNMDHAFIISLVVILDAVNSNSQYYRRRSRRVGGA